MVSQSSSVGYTIMGKTADLTVVQKTTIDTFAQGGQDTKGHCKRGWLFTELCVQAY